MIEERTQHDESPSREWRPARWSRALIDELLESLPDAVIGCDARGVIVFWSKGARERYGYSAAEAMGQRAFVLLQTRLPAPPLEIIEDYMDSGSWRGVITHRDKYAREHTVESRWTARYDDAGKYIGGFAVEREPVPSILPAPTAAPPAQDPRDTGRAERLEGLGQLARGIAHDFNNALGIVINYATMVSADIERLHHAPTDEERETLREDLAEIQAAAERAAQLTHQLLDFSRPGPGGAEGFDLHDSICGLQPELAEIVGDGISVVTDVRPDLHAVGADAGAVRQMLVNLAANARDAMPDGGTLTVEAANVELEREGVGRDGLPPGSYVRLRVSDTGEGMSPKVLERAFDPFFTTKPVGRNTGLGLSTVYGIVTRAGGHAEFFSEPGLGTTFVALLPARSDAAAAPKPPVAQGPPAVASEPATILLAEDEPAMREVTQRILESAGHRVIAAPDGTAARETAAELGAGSIDLLLTDVVMPGMLGVTLAAQLRAERPGLPVLFMSGFADSVLAEATSAEPVDLIEKPFTAVELLRRVERARAGSAASGS